jgi:uncharacterized protein (UPF0335 family)
MVGGTTVKAEARELIDRLNHLTEKQAKLAKDLEVSYAIKAVWPEAWDGGCTVKLVAREVVRTMQKAEQDRKRGKVPQLKACYLLRSDGVQFPVPAEVYWMLRELMRGESNV